ncbi:hypothetical protein BDFG_02054 [Blastomyces dermatitidis ATCC 26199]|nr:hypothetical protein BDFG_02054 [Blastomyces dermatitidis ATCC 26199]
MQVCSSSSLQQPLPRPMDVRQPEFRHYYCLSKPKKWMDGWDKFYRSSLPSGIANFEKSDRTINRGKERKKRKKEKKERYRDSTSFVHRGWCSLFVAEFKQRCGWGFSSSRLILDYPSPDRFCWLGAHFDILTVNVELKRV